MTIWSRISRWTNAIKAAPIWWVTTTTIKTLYIWTRIRCFFQFFNLNNLTSFLISYKIYLFGNLSQSNLKCMCTNTDHLLKHYMFHRSNKEDCNKSLHSLNHKANLFKFRVEYIFLSLQFWLQLVPPYGELHNQTYAELPAVWHVPPFWHGLLRQALTLKQFKPMYQY